MDYNVLKAKLEMFRDFLSSFQENYSQDNYSTSDMGGAQGMVNIALELSRIAEDATTIVGNVYRAIDAHYNYIPIEAAPDSLELEDYAPFPEWLQEALGAEAKKNGRKWGEEAVGILEKIFKDSRPQTAAPDSKRETA